MTFTDNMSDEEFLRFVDGKLTTDLEREMYARLQAVGEVENEVVSQLEDQIRQLTEEVESGEKEIRRLENEAEANDEETDLLTQTVKYLEGQIADLREPIGLD